MGNCCSERENKNTYDLKTIVQFGVIFKGVQVIKEISSHYKKIREIKK